MEEQLKVGSIIWWRRKGKSLINKSYVRAIKGDLVQLSPNRHFEHWQDLWILLSEIDILIREN